MLVQMGFGTFIVGMAPIFWDLARAAAVAEFLLGLAIILHTLYTDSRRTNGIVTGLQNQVDSLKRELAELREGSAPSEPVPKHDSISN